MIDAANPSTVYADAPLNITVTKPPGFIAKYLWVIIGILALIALIILAWLLLRAARRARVDVRSLRAEISRDGEQRGNPLRPPGTWSDTFSFVIRDEDNKHARLELPQPGAGDPTYVAKRGGPGQVRVWTPAGQEHEVTVGSAGELLQNGLRLAFRDTKKRGPGWSVPFVPGPGTKKNTKKKSPPVQPQPTSPQPVHLCHRRLGVVVSVVSVADPACLACVAAVDVVPAHAAAAATVDPAAAGADASRTARRRLDVTTGWA